MLVRSIKLSVNALTSVSYRSKPRSRNVKLRKPQIGASGIEYAVIAGLIIVAFVAAFNQLDLAGFFQNIVTQLSGVIGLADDD